MTYDKWADDYLYRELPTWAQALVTCGLVMIAAAGTVIHLAARPFTKQRRKGI